MKKVICLILFVLYSSSVFATGIIPPTYTLPFTPYKKENLLFSVSGYSNITLELSCPEWLKYNNDPHPDEDNRIAFSVAVELPKEITTPGEHRCGFVVKEYQDPNIPPSFSGIRAITQVGGTIIIQVPYPEKYAIISLNINNANKGEPIFVGTYLKNFGSETLFNVHPTITIYEMNNKTVDTFLTAEIERLETHQETTLWKKIDTNLYEAAKYRAVAMYDYGGREPAKDEKFFFIGKPYVDILQTTANATAGEFSKYSIQVESWWGNPIMNVYGLVNISNLSLSRTFQTVSIDLPPWSKGELLGYFDAAGLSEGVYEANIELKYQGELKTTKNTTLTLVEVKQEPEAKKLPLVAIAIITLLIIILLINAIFIWKKRNKVVKANEKK